MKTGSSILKGFLAGTAEALNAVSSGSNLLTNFYEIIASIHGPIRVTLDDTLHVVSPQSCLIVTAGKNPDEKLGTEVLRILVKCSAPPNNRALETIKMSPLLREIINFINSVGAIEVTRPEHRALYRVLKWQLACASKLNNSIPIPRESRARRIFEFLAREQLYHESLETLSRRAGASSRTVERLLLSEVGMSFSELRRKMRMQQAILLLSDGHTVTEVAMEVGYKSSSAFINAFREEIGTSPKKFLRQREGSGS